MGLQTYALSWHMKTILNLLLRLIIPKKKTKNCILNISHRMTAKKLNNDFQHLEVVLRHSFGS